MDTGVVVVSLIIHLCTFSFDGHEYSVVPLADVDAMIAATESVRKQRPGIMLSLLVRPTNEGCKQDAPDMVPYVEEK